MEWWGWLAIWMLFGDRVVTRYWPRYQLGPWTWDMLPLWLFACLFWPLFALGAFYD